MDYPNTITGDYLESIGAHCPDLDAFKKMYPKGVRFTEENVANALERHINVDWFVRHAFKGEVFKPYWKMLTDFSEHVLNGNVKPGEATQVGNAILVSIAPRYWAMAVQIAKAEKKRKAA